MENHKSAMGKINYSKYDTSGTDPNRYATVSNKKEADSYLHKGKKSIIPGLRVNVGKTERIMMIAAGTYLLYRALKKQHGNTKKVSETIAAGSMLFRGVSGYCPAYDILDKRKHATAIKGTSTGTGNASVTTSLTIKKPSDVVYEAWRKLENLPLFMKHLDSVMVTDEKTSQWKAKIPGGLGTIDWTAKILVDEPGEILSWHSEPGSSLSNAGKVKFKDNGNDTDIEVTISYEAPLGEAGKVAADLLTPVFEKMLQSDIEGFKKYIEKK